MNSNTMSIDNSDKDVLRRLADEVARIAALPVQKEKAALWIRLNNLEKTRPLIRVDQIPWHEMNVDDELTTQCKSDWAMGWETRLRRTIYSWKHMPGDMTVNDYLTCPLAIRSTGMGICEDVDIVKSDADNDVVSRHFIPQITEPEDVDKIKMPVVTHDEEATGRSYQMMNDVFGDIMPVRKMGKQHIWFTPWDNIIRWWGIQEALMDLVLRPDMVNAVVSRFVDASLCELEQWEKLNLLSLDNDNSRTGSGGYGYTDQLPGDDFDPDYVRPHNKWGCSNAQIFSEVSPEMHWEFALKHEMRWLEKFGLNYYGCCEPLDGKMDLMRKIPNLRKVTMSPWIKLDRAVAEVRDDYVFSCKPNPAILAEDNWSPERVRRDLSELMEKTKDCRVEIIMKDISTVRYEPQRLWEWAQIAMEVADEYA